MFCCNTGLAQVFDYETHFDNKILEVEQELKSLSLSDIQREALIRRISTLKVIKERHIDERALLDNDKTFAISLDYDRLTKEQKLLLLENQYKKGLISEANYLAQKESLK